MRIYLDYAATTPVDPRVTETMFNWQDSHFGNPSSPHRHGQESKIALENVRDLIAAELSCNPKEISFTSGGTESNNIALMGYSLANQAGGKHIIVSAGEHPSVLSTAEYLQKSGFEVSQVQPEKNGQLLLKRLEELIRPDTILISVMYINNETGAINPVNEIGELCAEKNIAFHCDAVQAFAKIKIDLSRFPVDFLSFSGHKIYGPKGVGGLFIRSNTAFNAHSFGGGQESNKRPGTENLVGIIGMGKAVELMAERQAEWVKIEKVKNAFEAGLCDKLNNIKIICSEIQRSPYISNISFQAADNQSLLLGLDLKGVSVSVGSACSSGSIKQSHVLKSMNLAEEVINSSIRFSFGRFTKEEEITEAIKIISGEVEILRDRNRGR